jgi:hypothetical protein
MLSVDTETQKAQATLPTAALGFWAGVATNTIAAVMFWVGVSHKYSYDWVGYHYEEWLRPISVFLAAAVVSGLVALAASGWRRFGVGLIAGAGSVAVADIGWTFLYLATQGS